MHAVIPHLVYDYKSICNLIGPQLCNNPPYSTGVIAQLHKAASLIIKSWPYNQSTSSSQGCGHIVQGCGYIVDTLYKVVDIVYKVVDTLYTRLWAHCIQGCGHIVYKVVSTHIVYKVVSTLYTRLWAHCIQGCEHIVYKVVSTLYTRLWTHCIQGCEHIVYKVVSTLYTRLWAHCIQGCEHIVYKVVSTLYTRLWTHCIQGCEHIVYKVVDTLWTQGCGYIVDTLYKVVDTYSCYLPLYSSLKKAFTTLSLLLGTSSCHPAWKSHIINLLLHSLRSGQYGEYSALWFCIVPPGGRANTAILELNIHPFCPPSHAIYRDSVLLS